MRDYLYIPLGGNRSGRLDGLRNLDSVEGNVGIYSNDSLGSLDGLRKLKTVDGYLVICLNLMLPSCEAKNLVKQLRGFRGTVTIEGNNYNGTCE